MVPTGGGSNNASHDQGATIDIGYAFDGVTTGTFETAFLDGQVGLPQELVSSVCMVLTGVVSYFLWSRLIPSCDRR